MSCRFGQLEKLDAQALNDLGLNTVAVEGLLGSAALSSFGLASGGKRWEDSLEMAVGSPVTMAKIQVL